MARKRCAVVTGGAGFLGSHLCDRLLADGLRVVCVDNLSSGRIENVEHLVGAGDFEFVERDVTEAVHVPGAVDVVYSLACPASPQDYLNNPIETLRAGSHGTLHTVELATAKGARFVLASTSEVYGSPRIHPQPEGYWGNVNPIGPRSVYDEAKRYGEALTTAFRATAGTDTIIVRVFNTYGPRMRADDGRVVPTFLGQALANQPITVYGSGRQTRSLCYVDDLVDGLVRAADSTLSGPINLGNPHEITVCELAELIISLSGSMSPLVELPGLEDDPERRCPDITLARSALRWQPQIDLVSGLTRTMKWFAERM